MEYLNDIYIKLKNQLEEFLLGKVLPIIFKLILMGVKVTLAWAFYQMGKNTIQTIF